MAYHLCFGEDLSFARGLLSFLIVSVVGVFWERACTLPVMLCAGEGSFQSVLFGAQPEKTYLHLGTLA